MLGVCLRFQDGFHYYLALRIHHRYADGCLMNVQPNILFTVHKGAPFRRWCCHDHNLLQQGRPFIMRLQQLMGSSPTNRLLARVVESLSPAITSDLPVAGAQFHDASVQRYNSCGGVASATYRPFGKVSSLICVSITNDLKTGLPQNQTAKPPTAHSLL